MAQRGDDKEIEDNSRCHMCRRGVRPSTVSLGSEEGESGEFASKKSIAGKEIEKREEVITSGVREEVLEDVERLSEKSMVGNSSERQEDPVAGRGHEEVLGNVDEEELVRYGWKQRSVQ